MLCFRLVAWVICILGASLLCASTAWSQDTKTTAVASDDAVVRAKPTDCLRVATFNVSFNRKTAGKLTEDLKSGDVQIQRVATILRALRPDIVLLNEVDYNAAEDNAKLFAQRYLADDKADILGGHAWPMEYTYSAPVNTGVPSGLDINGNSKVDDPEDAWGFGTFPGQYGMAILSRYPIKTADVRTFQNLKWSAMPDAKQPFDPTSKQPYYKPEVWSQLRLPSKSFWDVPIETPFGLISVIASHPTPPAFDGPADHNGCRNHDEIRLIVDYLSPTGNSYMIDDQGRQGGRLSKYPFVVLGDLNSDPVDGESQRGAIRQLISHSNVAQIDAPTSRGAVAAAKAQAKKNLEHTSPSEQDTADFFDGAVGNLRVDYALPSKDLSVISSGVFWPGKDEHKTNPAIIEKLSDASDHHAVWIDVRFGPSK